MNSRDIWRLVDLAVSLILIFLLSASLCTKMADAATLDWSEHDKNKIVVISGEVDQRVIGQSGFITQIAGEPVIRIVINTPGGSVIAGNMFIRAMEVAKSKGSKIECVVTNLAASMGMHIFAHCTERYAVVGGLLLFHEARVGLQGYYTERDLRRMAENIYASTRYLEPYLQGVLGCSPEFYRQHNEGETMWAVEYFKEVFPKFKLKIVNGISLPYQFDTPIFNPLGNKKGEKSQPKPNSRPPLLVEAS